MRFYAVDTLSGRILDRLHPVTWELGDPLRTPGVGTLTLHRPTPEKRSTLVEVTQPRRRWVAAQDEASGRWLWGGPIPRKPSVTREHVIVPLVDWRTFFYHAYARPTEAGDWQDYAVTDRDQTLIADDLFKLALDSTAWPGEDTELAMPPIVVDAPVASGVDRDLSLRMLDRSVGEKLDALVESERGIEWWTYVASSLSDPQVLEVHVRTAYPERMFRGTPLRVEWRDGIGGNASEAKWPEGVDAPTRVWGTGDGEPPDQVWAVAESDSGGVVWESRIGPLDGVKRARTAFEHAFEAVERGEGEDRRAEFTIPAEKVGLGDVDTGDRCRVIYDDGWESVDLDNARIIDRTLSGGRGQPTQQRLVIDLSDVEPPDDGTEPGEPGESDEGGA